MRPPRAYFPFQSNPLNCSSREVHKSLASHKKFGAVLWWIFSLVALSVGISYILLPTSKQKLTEGPQSHLDSEHELDALHHEPSPYFCQLRRRPLVCAHGGDIETAPPNTLASFAAALEGGADCVEVDVSMTKDGQLVALHDRDLAMLLERSSAAAGIQWQRQPPHHTHRNLLSRWRQSRRVHLTPRTGDYTWDQLRRLEWEHSNGAHGIATLQSVLSMVLEAPYDISITVDVKLRESLDENEEAEEVVMRDEL